MFTGIVEELGKVTAHQSLDGAARLTVRGPTVAADAVPGDSIAVNGCCLTVVERDEETFRCDVMAETLRATALGALRPGSPVNLERAVTPSTRLGGHVVQGHVDGTGTVRAREAHEHWELVRLSYPPELGRFLVAKGSITVDGVSLTVVEVDDEQAELTVSLIPETLRRTTLGLREPGELVNLEVDVLAKYVARQLEQVGLEKVGIGQVGLDKAGTASGAARGQREETAP